MLRKSPLKPTPSSSGRQFFTEEHRLKHFNSSADIAVALLASATCGISGLPFKFRDEEGQEQTVADGAALGPGDPAGTGDGQGAAQSLKGASKGA